LLLLGLCSPGFGAEAPPDVVLVTLDTTRADRLGCYGDATARTPTIDALAAGGTRFARAVTPSPLTLPAHASLMTGLIPPRHGLRDNGLAALPSDLPTVAEAFRAAGYATGAVVASAVLDHRFGLDRGFDLYDDSLTAELLGEYGYPERDAEAVTDAALEWGATLDEDSPYFLWVHYYDPHSPYVDRENQRSGGSPDELYAAEIAWVDGQLKRLLDGLPGDGGTRIVAIVGDHGEMLGEHGERAHGLLLYRGSLEVPLILAGPGVEPGRVVKKTSATRGLGATIIQLATGTAPEALGPPLLDSFGDGASQPQPVYSETWLPATAYGWSPMLSISRGDWRYVQAPQPELFNFVADPAESRNLVSAEPERAAELRTALGSFAGEGGVARERAPPAEDAADLNAQLRALGYLSGMTGAPAGEDGDAIDPKDGIAWLDDFEEAKRLMNAGDVWAARARLDALVRRNPGNVPFLMRAADARFATGDEASGMALLEKALEINPRLDLLHLRMGNTRLALGDAAGAEAAYRDAVELNPRLASAWLGLAQLAGMAGDTATETSRLEEAVEKGTVSAGIHARLGQLALARGDLSAAESQLRMATELVPSLAAAWWSWGLTAERSGDLAAAVERFGRAIELNPGDAAARRHLGRLLAGMGREEEARRLTAQDRDGSRPRRR
jgi:arylsulfatase A-like enzyme/Flp pilus assembly protein TadD